MNSSPPNARAGMLLAAAALLLLLMGAATVVYFSRQSNTVSTNDIADQPDTNVRTDESDNEDPQPVPDTTTTTSPAPTSSLISQPAQPGDAPAAPSCYRYVDPAGDGIAAAFFLPPNSDQPAVAYRLEDGDGVFTIWRFVGENLSGQRYRMVMDAASEGGLSLGSRMWTVSPSGLLDEGSNTTTDAVSCNEIRTYIDQMIAFGDTLPAPDPKAITPEGVRPILAPGRYCYVDRQASPMRDMFRIDVADDHSVVVEARGWSEDPGFFPTLTETGTGEFLDHRSMWLAITVDFNGQRQQSADLFVVEPGKLFVSPQRFENDEVDCAAIEWAFNDGDADPAYTTDESVEDVAGIQPTKLSGRLAAGEAARYRFTLDEATSLTISTSPANAAIRYLLTDPSGATKQVVQADAIQENTPVAPLHDGQVATPGTYELVIQAIYGPVDYGISVQLGP